MELYKSLLKELIQFKSISTDPKHQEDVNKTAEWLKKTFDENGFTSEVITGYANPVVFASYVVDTGFETILIYGHYDVQPASVEDGWLSDPFTLTEKDGKMYARGVVDNKGQFLVHMATAFKLIKEGSLGYNLKFIIEGNEETGSGLVGKLLKEQKEKFSSNHVVISDGELPYKPVITASFRGTFNMTLKYTTADHNLHSGLYGGTVPNAAEELSTLISKLKDKEYLVTIPDFYDGQDEVTDLDLENCKEMDKEKVGTLEHTKVKKIFKGPSESFCANLGFTTMFTVSGFKSGYIGDGYSNIVPSEAEARINFRIAASQDPESVYNSFKNFVEENTPEYVTVEFINVTEFAKPIRVDLNSKKHKEVISLMEDVYGSKVLVDYCGATIPVVVDFKEELGVDPLLISLGNDDCNMHGPNENFDLGLLEKALTFSERFFSKS